MEQPTLPGRFRLLLLLQLFGGGIANARSYANGYDTRPHYNTSFGSQRCQAKLRLRKRSRDFCGGPEIGSSGALPAAFVVGLLSLRAFGGAFDFGTLSRLGKCDATQTATSPLVFFRASLAVASDSDIAAAYHQHTGLVVNESPPVVGATHGKCSERRGCVDFLIAHLAEPPGHHAKGRDARAHGEFAAALLRVEDIAIDHEAGILSECDCRLVLEGYLHP